MSGSEKFMFDTIFDELEPIVPKTEAEELAQASEEEEAIEEEPEIIVPTFSEEEVAAARQEGFAQGKEQGVSETLASIEKSSSDALGVITGHITTLFTSQAQVNREITDDATALSLAVVRKFFPLLNEENALNEVVSTVETLLRRLVNEPRIQITCNPEISDDLAAKLAGIVKDKGLHGSISVVADEEVKLGDCDIQWSNGSARRNLNALMREIDDIIRQNSTAEIESLTMIEELDEPVPEEAEPEEIEIEEPEVEEAEVEELGEAENIANMSEHSEEHSDSPDLKDLEDAFEQNIKDAELELTASEPEENSDIELANEPAIESIEENSAVIEDEIDDTSKTVED